MRKLARNTGLNLVGLGVPMLAAVAATPLLIQGLGGDRFGVLAMAWGVVGYFSVLDLGLGRALTQVVAERMATSRDDEVPGLVWTALVLLLGFGAVGTLILAPSSRYLVEEVLNVPIDLQREATTAFVVLSISLPLVTSTAGLRGVLEAAQRFGVVNALRLPLGLLTFLGPLLVLPFTRSLGAVVGVLVAGRAIAWLAHAVMCFRTVPALKNRIVLDRAALAPLLSFGGWMTLSNIASAVMVYLDRFLIGAMMSLAAVTFYVTPYEVIWRLTLLPSALLAVLFPLFASSFASDRSRAAALFDWGGRTVYLVMFPVVLLLVLFAGDLLHIWLGAEFARQSAPVVQWLAVGIFLLSFAMVAATGLQGAGMPRATGIVNVLELPFYVALLWWLVREFGIAGAAAAWAVRAGVDAIVLNLIARRAALVSASALARIAWLAGLAIPVLAIAATLQTLPTRMAFAGLVVALFGLMGWHVVLAPGERATLRARLIVGAGA